MTVRHPLARGDHSLLSDSPPGPCRLVDGRHAERAFVWLEVLLPVFRRDDLVGLDMVGLGIGVIV